MYVIMGATGHVGGATARALLDQGEAVTVVVRNAAKGEAWAARGAKVAVADVHDVEGLRAAFQRGRRAFLLNPPADPSGDTDAAEHATVAAILDALDGSGLEKVVALSTYGAQPGHEIGDLGTLWTLEEGLRAQPIPATVVRAAYLMSNWDGLVDAAREGTLPTSLPSDLRLAMVAPADLGRAAARLLREPPSAGELRHVEGPERLTLADVADAFATALGRSVTPEVTPREGWETMYQALGFSRQAARSYAGMTARVVDGVELPEDPECGTTTIEAYLRAVLA